jgi:hypothetical protein
MQLRMFGHMDDSFSKAEALRIRRLLEKQIKAGRNAQLDGNPNGRDPWIEKRKPGICT